MFCAKSVKSIQYCPLSRNIPSSTTHSYPINTTPYKNNIKTLGGLRHVYDIKNYFLSVCHDVGQVSPHLKPCQSLLFWTWPLYPLLLDMGRIVLPSKPGTRHLIDRQVISFFFFLSKKFLGYLICSRDTLGRYRARKKSRIIVSWTPNAYNFRKSLAITPNTILGRLFKFQTATLPHWAVFGGRHGGLEEVLAR